MSSDFEDYEKAAEFSTTNPRGWQMRVHLLKPRNPADGYILASREKATGLTKETIVKTTGLAYWNHALFFHLTDGEANMFQSICNDADDREKNFAKFYADLTKKAFSVKEKQWSIIYAVAVYGGRNENELKGYIVVPPRGYGAHQLMDTYNLWSWTIQKKKGL